MTLAEPPHAPSTNHSGRVDLMMVALVVVAGSIYLPTLGIGEVGAPDPLGRVLLLVPAFVGATRELLLGLRLRLHSSSRSTARATTPAAGIARLSWPGGWLESFRSPFGDLAVALTLGSVVWMSVSSLAGPEPLDGAVRGGWFLLSGITLVGITARAGLDRTLAPAAMSTAGVIGVGLGLHAIGVIDGAWEIELSNEPLFPWTRMNVLGANQTIVGLSGALAALASPVVARRHGTLAGVAVGVLGVAGVAASHNRSAIAALCAGALAAAAWTRGRWALAAVAGSFGAAGVAVFSTTLSRRLNRDSLVDDEIFDFYEGSERGVFTGRGEVWADAWRFGLERPLVGRGNGAFAQTSAERFLSGAKRRNPGHPHNVVLEVFTDQGLVGVLVLLAATIAVVRRRDRWRPVTAAILTAVAVHSVVEAMFYGSPSPRWTFLVIVVGALASGPASHPPRAQPTGEHETAGVDQQRSAHAEQPR
ncbi:MAG: O-antigen ligase family protein [Actinomycetota bacterium]